MARFLIEAVECQDIAQGRWLDVVQGGRFDFPTARGENVTYPSKPGQTAMPWVADQLPIKVIGPVWGDGATAVLRRASFATRMGALRTALGSIGNVVTLTLHPPNEALATGQTATIEAQVIRVISDDPQGWEQQVLDIELHCLSDPPVWVVA